MYNHTTSPYFSHERRHRSADPSAYWCLRLRHEIVASTHDAEPARREEQHRHVVGRQRAGVHALVRPLRRQRLVEERLRLQLEARGAGGVQARRKYADTWPASGSATMSCAREQTHCQVRVARSTVSSSAVTTERLSASCAARWLCIDVANGTVHLLHAAR